jgi:hypothetical protein
MFLQIVLFIVSASVFVDAERQGLLQRGVLVNPTSPHVRHRV